MRCRKPFLAQIEQLHSVTSERSAVTRTRTRPQWQPPNIVCGIYRSSAVRRSYRENIAEKILLVVLHEHLELRGVARGLGNTEMAECVRGEQAAARRALEKAALDQERL